MLTVIIAFLCAASVFVLVRHFWVIAARQVTKRMDVPAYALLSLNTVGETIDVVWLLRHEILSSRYRSLLIQCIFVVVLTVCTMLSGFIARASTRSVTAIVERDVEGSLATRDTESILYDSLDITAVYKGLVEAKFPQTKLIEFWPSPYSGWIYNDEQWNSSWTMDCKYNDTTLIPDTSIVTDNCTNGVWQQWPWIYDNWWDWGIKESSYSYYNSDGINFSQDENYFRDVLLFVHGYEIYTTELRDGLNLTTSLTMRTVAIHLHNVPRNGNDSAECTWVQGPIESAEYSSTTCDLKRNLGTRTGTDLDTWGAAPELADLDHQVSAYTQFYAGRLRRESFAGLPITNIPGHELAQIFQAYQATKDTGGTLYYNITDPSRPKMQRTLDVSVHAAQVSLVCLVVCGVLAFVVLLGLLNYWLFVLLHFRHLHATPQSKLDWMLQTLKKEGAPTDNKRMRHHLRDSISSPDLHAEIVPLTKLDKAAKSMDTATVTTREVEADEIASGTPRQTNLVNYVWSPISPPQYQVAGTQPWPGLSIMNRNDYSRVPSASPYAYSGWDAAYDSGRR